MAETRLVYIGGRVPEPPITPVCYHRDFFQLELELESEVFSEIRRRNGIEPARLHDSTPEELAKIGDFFLKCRESFYFLFHENGDVIGSILHIDSYIQSLCVAAKYQRQGYGDMLSRYCINRILDSGYDYVELDIIDGNRAAERLYRKLGFEEKNERNAQKRKSDQQRGINGSSC